MQTQSQSQSVSETKQKYGSTFRIVSWLAFWLELGLAVVSALAILFALSGQNFSTETNTGISIGLFWAVCGIVALLFNVFLAFRYGRIGKHLLNPNSDSHPSKADTIKLLQLGVIVSLVGILLCLLGAGATIGVLVAKSVSQPPGVAITDAYKIIRALDVFAVVANVNGIAAHFVGVLTSLGLYQWLHR